MDHQEKEVCAKYPGHDIKTVKEEQYMIQMYGVFIMIEIVCLFLLCHCN